MSEDLPPTIMRNLFHLAAPLTEPSVESHAEIGRYRIVREAGRGGMGVVYEAVDPALQRRVALKLMMSGDDEEIARFEREAQTVAKLSHPNIAAVYEVGQAEGRHFIAMQYVDGPTLAEYPATDRRRMAALVRDAALALQYAHEQGIVHRDVKPQNLMVETSPGGAPRLFVLDFGLAKRRAVDASISISGRIVGTPAYMSPEQVSGRTGAVDAQSDVYALGATLYELLAGRPPFQGSDVLDVLQRVQNEDPVPIRRLRPEIEPELETIAMKCLEKDRERRYASARDLADDLKRWFDGEAIRAHPASWWYRARKRLSRRRALVWMAALGVAAALAVVLPWILSERARSGQAERGLMLWGKISKLLGDAELYSRQGDRERAMTRLEEGAHLCTAHAESDSFAPAWYFLGRIRHAQGKREEAIAALDRALTLDPELGEAQFERGLLRVEEIGVRAESNADGFVDSAGEPDELSALAFDDLQVKVGKTSYFSEVDGRYGLAEMHRLMGDLTGAETEHRLVLKDEPLYAPALVALSRIALAHRDPDEAVRKADAAIEMHKGLASARWARSRAYLYLWRDRPDEKGRHRWRKQALEDVDAAIRLGETSAEAFAARAGLRCDFGVLDGALEDVGKALAADPKLALALHERGRVQVKRKNSHAGIADFTRALESRPEFADAYVSRAKAHVALGEHADAEADFAAALRIAPEEAQIFAERGAARVEAGRLEEAIADFGKAIELRPGMVEAWSRRCDARRAAGDFTSAIADGTKALELDLADVDANVRLGKAYLANADPGAAMGALHAAVQIAPDRADVFALLSIAAFRLGALDSAFAHATKALELDANLAEARYARAEVLRGRGELDAAMPDYDAAIKTDPTQADFWCGRALAHLAGNDVQGAQKDWTEALLLQPGHFESRAGRGDLRAQRGDREGALEDLQVAVDKTPPNWRRKDEVAKRLEEVRGEGEAVRAAGPEQAFNAAHDACLAGEPEAMFAHYSARKQRAVGGWEGFKSSYEANQAEWEKLFRGARVTFVSIDGDQANADVLWGNGEPYPVVPFVREGGEWKIEQ